MSFILEALKKSEVQRQRQLGPGFATVRSGGQQDRFPLWVVLLGGLLLINAIVLSVVFWPRESAPPMPEVVESNATAPASPPKNTASSSIGTNARRDVRSLAREASMTGDNNANSKTPTETPAASKKNGRREGGSVIIMDESEMDEYLGIKENVATRSSGKPGGSVTHIVANPGASEEYLRDLVDLQLNGEINLPEIHLDVHVYSENPADRFVFVNMKKYRENEKLREGPIIEAITAQGVILVYNGQRFSLSAD